MDKDRALAAIGAIRHIPDLDKRPHGYSPNPASGEDAGNQIRIIRDNGPKSCHWKLVPFDVGSITFSSERTTTVSGQRRNG